MKSKPLVSVLVITYNQESYIQQTLDSVLKQCYDNLEIVVADDGSTDGTSEIILQYAQQYPDIIKPILGGPNLGITGNSNRGLRQCSGTYLAILGGDDIMLPSKIKMQVDYMELKQSCSVSYHDMDVFESTTGKTMHRYSSRSRPREGSLREVIKYGTINCASSTMYRMAAISKTGFHPDLPVVSDWMFTIESLASGGKIGYINTILGRYRRHQYNVSNLDSPFRLQGQQDLLHSCAICMNKYPQYLTAAVYRLSAIFRESRNLHGGVHYASYLKASLITNLSAKAILGLLTFYLSFKRVRL